MEPVRLEREGDAAILTLARGEKGNRLDIEMLEALDRATRIVAESAGLRALLLRAEGRMFCVGGAIDEFVSTGDFVGYLREVLSIGHPIMARLAALPIPVVTAIQGPAGGAGLGLALCGDFALASTSASFRAGYPALGVSSDFGVSFLLARLGGARLATDMLMTNRLVLADEAQTRGLVTSVHGPDALDLAARELLVRLARGPTVAHAMTRAAMRFAGAADFVAHLAHEEAAMLVTAGTADAAEGIAAFLEKRPAVFGGA